MHECCVCHWGNSIPSEAKDRLSIEACCHDPGLLAGSAAGRLSSASATMGASFNFWALSCLLQATLTSYQASQQEAKRSISFAQQQARIHPTSQPSAGGSRKTFDKQINCNLPSLPDTWHGLTGAKRKSPTMEVSGGDCFAACIHYVPRPLLLPDIEKEYHFLINKQECAVYKSNNIICKEW